MIYFERSKAKVKITSKYDMIFCLFDSFLSHFEISVLVGTYVSYCIKSEDAFSSYDAEGPSELHRLMEVGVPKVFT